MTTTEATEMRREIAELRKRRDMIADTWDNWGKRAGIDVKIWHLEGCLKYAGRPVHCEAVE